MKFNPPISRTRKFAEDQPGQFLACQDPERLYRRNIHKRNKSEGTYLQKLVPDVPDKPKFFEAPVSAMISTNSDLEMYNMLDEQFGKKSKQTSVIKDLQAEMTKMLNQQRATAKEQEQRKRGIKDQLLGIIQNSDFQLTARLSELLRTSQNSNVTKTGPGSSFLISEPLDNSDFIPEYTKYAKRMKASNAKTAGNLGVIKEALTLCLEHDPELKSEVLELLDNFSLSDSFALLLRNSREFAGLYQRRNGDLRKLIGDNAAPDVIMAEMVKTVYKIDLKEGELVTSPLFGECDAVLLRSKFNNMFM